MCVVDTQFDISCTLKLETSKSLIDTSKHFHNYFAFLITRAIKVRKNQVEIFILDNSCVFLLQIFTKISCQRKFVELSIRELVKLHFTSHFDVCTSRNWLLLCWCRANWYKWNWLHQIVALILKEIKTISFS